MGLICFCDKMRKNLVCVLMLQFIFLSAPNLHQLQNIWVKRYPNEMDLQIFYTLFVSGLNVQVSGKITPNEMDHFHKALPNVKNSLKFYPRPPKNLHRYICHICDIMQLCNDQRHKLTNQKKFTQTLTKANTKTMTKTWRGLRTCVKLLTVENLNS